jgi:diamine N-acetyltransferase
MKIVACTESDLEALVAVSVQTFCEAFEKVSNPENFRKYVSENLNAEKIATELAEPTTAFYFLKNETADILGYCKLRSDRSAEFFGEEPALELQRIYLKEQYWGSGAGKFLLDFCENRARTQGFNWLWLVVWFDNTRAIRFYEQNNWLAFAKKDFKFGNEIHHDVVFKKAMYQH